MVHFSPAYRQAGEVSAQPETIWGQVTGTIAIDTCWYQCGSNSVGQELGQGLQEVWDPWALIETLKGGSAITSILPLIPLSSGHRRALFYLTFDFLERWIRNFSYCSIAKIRFGMGLVSRSTLAWNAERSGIDQIENNEHDRVDLCFMSMSF